MRDLRLPRAEVKMGWSEQNSAGAVQRLESRGAETAQELDG